MPRIMRRSSPGRFWDPELYEQIWRDRARKVDQEQLIGEREKKATSPIEYLNLDGLGCMWSEEACAAREQAFLERATRQQDLSPILLRYGSWAVTEYGVECLVSYYPIEKARLDEQDWILQVAGKPWVNAFDFTAAYMAARELHRNRKRADKPTRFAILQRDGFKCQLCGTTKDHATLHVDHRVPLARGGKNTPENMWTLCQACNASKSDRSL